MKKFYNPNTKFDPDYHNLQADLWSMTTDSQHAVIGGVFKHLKNHAQLEIASALIDYFEEGIKPHPYTWSDAVTGGIFEFIISQIDGSSSLNPHPSTLPLNKKGGKA